MSRYVETDGDLGAAMRYAGAGNYVSMEGALSFAQLHSERERAGINTNVIAQIRHFGYETALTMALNCATTYAGMGNDAEMRRVLTVAVACAQELDACTPKFHKRMESIKTSGYKAAIEKSLSEAVECNNRGDRFGKSLSLRSAQQFAGWVGKDIEARIRKIETMPCPSLCLTGRL